MEKITYPTPEDIVRLNDLIPEWVFSAMDFLTDNQPDFDSIFGAFEINSWARIISQRMKDADYAFIMSSFYLERGIPDEEWYRSSNSGIDYFPNFNEDHNRNKFAFEYHSDVYFYKVFSALDAMAHLLTIVYPLEWGKREKVYFPKAVEKIKDKSPQLYNELNVIMEQPEYKAINRLRNDATHNFSDGHVDSGVVREENIISLTVGHYMPVREKYEMMQWMCEKFLNIIHLISKKWNQPF